MATSDCHLDTWIILFDIEATVDIFSNPKLLKNIYSVDKTFTVKCNSSSKQIKMKGTLAGYVEVWFCALFIANILLLENVADRDGYHVWFNNICGNEFVVEKPNRTIHFHDGHNRLYQQNASQKAIFMVTTSKGNKEGCTRRQYKSSNADRCELGMVGYPSPKDFEKWYIQTGSEISISLFLILQPLATSSVLTLLRSE